jgi:hypothetical protein
MTMYLSGGWYRSGHNGGLRTEVIDGAMDAAGYLHRAGLHPQALTTLALKVRSLMTLIDPHMTAANGLGDEQRAIVAERLASLTEQSPELHAFVSDCLDHVQSRADLLAFYLHLVHVTRMLQLLSLAKDVAPPPGPPAWRPAAPVKAKAKAKKTTRRKKTASRPKKKR